MIDARREIELLVRSRLPFLAVHGADEERIEQLLTGAARSLDMPFYVWTLTRGLLRAGSLRALQRGKTLDEALEAAVRMQSEALFLFKDLQRWLDDPATVRRLLDVGRHFGSDRRTLVLAGPDIDLPPTLRHLCATWRLPRPSADDLHALARRVVQDFSLSVPVQVALDDEGFERLVDSLKGMTWTEAEHALRRCVADDLVLSGDDVAGVLEAKRRVLHEGGVLEYVPVEESLGQVGGLENLKRWLMLRRDALTDEARAFGLPPPKGVLLLGVQGCGKSLVAKAIAHDWGLPLLRLEAGRIYDKYIGESDKNLEEALSTAEHMAPCVLMIDEIEKAFAYAGSVDADGGLSRRIFGRLLGWLQDRDAPVFLVATCNDVSQLPPELMRKGRFDEIFFVDLPRPEERRMIFTVHLERRDRDPAAFDLGALAGASADFSGAEIEQAVVAGLYAAFAAGSELTTEVLLQELAATRPLAVTRRESIEALRSWADGRAVSAGAGDEA
ncbi:MAG: AAA family ATPase [Planctomycetota bacterium]|nr:AAA family ATPase [Planctomycetota bacterium]